MKRILKPSFAVDVKAATERLNSIYNTDLDERQISVWIRKEVVTVWLPPYLTPLGYISLPRHDSLEDTLRDIDSCLYDLMTARGNVEDYGNAWGFEYNDTITDNDIESAIECLFHWGLESYISPNLYLKLDTSDDNLWFWSVEVWNEKQLIGKVDFEDLAEDFYDLFFDGIGIELTDRVYNIVKNIK